MALRTSVFTGHADPHGSRKIISRFAENKTSYYMANPVLGTSLCSDWFFLVQDFAVSMETVQTVYFCFGAKPANSTFATKTGKKSVKIVILHIETTSRS